MTQTWYTTFTGKGAAANPDDAKKMCADALASFYSEGLNEFDAELILYAMTAKVTGLATAPSGAKVGTQCAGLTTNKDLKPLLTGLDSQAGGGS